MHLFDGTKTFCIILLTQPWRITVFADDESDQWDIFPHVNADAISYAHHKDCPYLAKYCQDKPCNQIAQNHQRLPTESIFLPNGELKITIDKYIHS